MVASSFVLLASMTVVPSGALCKLSLTGTQIRQMGDFSGQPTCTFLIWAVWSISVSRQFYPKASLIISLILFALSRTFPLPFRAAVYILYPITARDFYMQLEAASRHHLHLFFPIDPASQTTEEIRAASLSAESLA